MQQASQLRHPVNVADKPVKLKLTVCTSTSDNVSFCFQTNSSRFQGPNMPITTYPCIKPSFKKQTNKCGFEGVNIQKHAAYCEKRAFHH